MVTHMQLKSSSVRISGGLGNQLFQYAFSRNLTINTGSVVVLDLERYGLEHGNNSRRCELSGLFPGATFLNTMRSSTVKYLLENLPTRLKHKLLVRIESKIRIRNTFKGRRIVLERKIPYDSSVPLQDCNYYVGNFISPEYWWGNQELILKEIDYAVSISAVGANIPLPSKNSIAVHIRRGDYLDNKKTREFHGYCKDTYYLEALKILREENEFLNTVLISSDNSDYARYFSAKVQAMGFRVSLIENLDPVSNLFVLSRAHYFVGSNSTFSWWAAFLGNQKSTVFPQRWFMDHNIEINADRFYPSAPFLLDDALTSEPDNSYREATMEKR